MASIWNRTDEKLIEKIRMGGTSGERAASKLYLRYKSYAHGILFKRQFQAEEIETLYLDTMSAAILNIRNNRFKGKSSFKTYLSSILIRRSQDYLSTKVRQRKTFATQEQAYWDQLAKPETADLALEEAEIVQLVQHIFNSDRSSSKLKSECIRIYEYLARGFDWESIAIKIERSVQAAKNKRARCFEHLVSALNENFPQEKQVLASMYQKLAKDYE